MKVLHFAWIVSLVATGLAGCATVRTPLLSTPAVSMTDQSFENGYQAKPAGQVSSQFCYGDSVSSHKDDLNIGMMDEVIAKAQTETGARYIANAQFFTQGNCMVLEGVAMK